jgi:hypothetical protein
MALFNDSLDILTRPIEDTADFLRDPLSDLQGLPGIDGTEPIQDFGILETVRKEKEKETQVTKQKRKESTSPSSRGLAVDDSASIATKTLLG